MGRINIDNAEHYLAEPVGVQKKEWIIINNKRYLFKEASIKDDGTPVYNDVSESIASDIISLAGIRSANYSLAERNGTKGVVTPDFLDNQTNGPKKEELIDGVSLINRVDPDFKNKSLINPKTHQYYTVSLVLESVEKYGLVKDALEMIVIDSIIANTDRNPSNYGIIINHETDTYRFAPLFDNATTLGISMVQHRLDQCYDRYGNVVDEEQLNLVMHHHIIGKTTIDRHFQIKEKNEWDLNEMAKISQLIEQKRSEIQIQLFEGKISETDYHRQLNKIGNDNRKYDISTMEYQPLVEYLTTFYPEEISSVIEKIKTNFTEENIDALFDKYKYDLPIDRFNFAKRMVKERSKWVVDYYENNKSLEKGGMRL